MAVEEYAVWWVPTERDECFRAWQAAADRWAEAQADPACHPADLWLAEMYLDEAKYRLEQMDVIAANVRAWLTRRWEDRMRRIAWEW